MDLISIIIPVYNVEKYLAECIESILQQDYERIEVLLIDDGSTDKSGEICDVFASRDSRIKVFHKENEGVAATRNYGLRHIDPQAKYIGFVDSDDIISHNMYQDLHAAIIQSAADMAICRFVCVNDKKEIIEEENAAVIKGGIFRTSEIIEQSTGYNGWCYRILWNKLYRRELFEGLSFWNGKIHEDEYLAYQLMLSCSKIVCREENGYYYRVSNEQSIMTKRTTKRNTHLLEAYMFNAKLLAENGYKEAAKKMLLRSMKEYGSLQSDSFACDENIKRQYCELLIFMKQRKYLNSVMYGMYRLFWKYPTVAYKGMSLLLKLRK